MSEATPQSTAAPIGGGGARGEAVPGMAGVTSAERAGTRNGASEVGSVSGAQWSMVLSVMERLAGSASLEEVLRSIIDSLRSCLHADRASVFQFDGVANELFISQGHGLAEIRFPTSAGIAGEAARRLEIINVPDCYADPRFNPAIDKKTGYRTRNMLTIPLISADGGLQGVAQVLNKDASLGESFDARDEQIARALASQAAVAIRRAKLLEAEIRKNKIEADLQIARKIQQSSWPKSLPNLPGMQLVACSMPADETGGDTYDVIDLRSLHPESEPGKAIVLMGDATGHGIGPALSISQFRAMVRMGARLGAPVSSIVKNLNQQMCDDLPPGRFITAFVGLIESETGTINYCSAGQAPLIVIRASGEVEMLEANMMPLGIDDSCEPDVIEPIRLGPGDLFMMLSDGYFEACDPDGNMLGHEPLVAIVAELLKDPQVSAKKLLEVINGAADAFVRGRAYDDDRTAILLLRKS